MQRSLFNLAYIWCRGVCVYERETHTLIKRNFHSVFEGSEYYGKMKEQVKFGG